MKLLVFILTELTVPITNLWNWLRSVVEVVRVVIPCQEWKKSKRNSWDEFSPIFYIKLKRYRWGKICCLFVCILLERYKKNPQDFSQCAHVRLDRRRTCEPISQSLGHFKPIFPEKPKPLAFTRTFIAKMLHCLTYDIGIDFLGTVAN